MDEGGEPGIKVSYNRRKWQAAGSWKWVRCRTKRGSQLGSWNDDLVRHRTVYGFKKNILVFCAGKKSGYFRCSTQERFIGVYVHWRKKIRSSLGGIVEGIIDARFILVSGLLVWMLRRQRKRSYRCCPHLSYIAPCHNGNHRWTLWSPLGKKILSRR